MSDVLFPPGPSLLPFDRPQLPFGRYRAHIVIWRYDLREKGRGSDAAPRPGRVLYDE